VYYAYSDHLNAPRVIVNSAGDISWRWISEPFGTTAAESIPNSLENLVVNLRFPGQYFDKESGLNYNYFRDYDATAGKYLQSDPLGLGGGINTYVYVEANPVSYVDPRGEFGIVGGLIGAGVEIGLQGYRNYRAGCDVFNLGNYNWWDVGAAGVIGAVAPGWGSVGKSAYRSGKAIGNLAGQLKRAQTANRVAKIEQRIQKNVGNVMGPLVAQGVFQGGKALVKEITNTDDSKECVCQQ